MALRHCVCVNFKPDATDEQKRVMVEKLQEFFPKVDHLLTDEFGPKWNIGFDEKLLEGNAEFQISVNLKGSAEYQEYHHGAAHQELVANYIRPILQSRMACQVRLGV